MHNQSLFEDESDDLGVEFEDTGGRITDPFDPNKIRVSLWSPTIDLVLRRIREKEIDLAADFQRKAGIWTPEAQSRLIESLLIRIPIPAFYMDGADENRYIVIDGIQRLTALRLFVIDKVLKLSGLEFLKDLEGLYFSELPRQLQRRIEETMLTVYIVEKGTPEGAKLNIFKRINTGGLPLNAQEIRHAINPGPVRNFLLILAESSEFLIATKKGVPNKRMDDRECVARFAAFAITPPTDYSTGDLDAWIDSGMKAINQMSEQDRAQLADRFQRSMKAAAEIFESDAFRKRYKEGDKRFPFNKALFETWSVNLDQLDDEQIARLTQGKERIRQAFMELMQDQEFDASVSRGTGDVNKVKTRFQRIKEVIKNVLDEN